MSHRTGSINTIYVETPSGRIYTGLLPKKAGDVTQPFTAPDGRRPLAPRLGHRVGHSSTPCSWSCDSATSWSPRCTCCLHIAHVAPSTPVAERVSTADIMESPTDTFIPRNCHSDNRKEEATSLCSLLQECIAPRVNKQT